MNGIEIKQELRKLGSRYRDQTPMYPGEWIFTWMRVPMMPWVLVAVEQKS